MPKVLIVDDNANVRRGLRALLLDESDAFCVGEATTGREALTVCRAEAWDLVLLDISLPRQSGLEVLRSLRHDCPALPVLMLSFSLEPDHIRQCLAIGALGYIAKEQIPEEILPAIEAALSGRQYLSTAVAHVLSHADASPH